MTVLRFMWSLLVQAFCSILFIIYLTDFFLFAPPPRFKNSVPYDIQTQDPSTVAFPLLLLFKYLKTMFV